MSMIQCNGCGEAIDTDLDPESLYVIEDQCWCRICRGESDLGREDDMKLNNNGG